MVKIWIFAAGGIINLRNMDFCRRRHNKFKNIDLIVFNSIGDFLTCKDEINYFSFGINKEQLDDSWRTYCYEQEKKLGVDKAVASFTVPLGATINMDGTAIMQGVATVFIASVYQVDLSLADYLTVILTATMASIGTAGVPGVGLIMLAMVLTQVGLPVEGIALIIGIDRLLDMMRTAVNITGDSMVSIITAKSEKSFDEKIFLDVSK